MVSSRSILSGSKLDELSSLVGDWAGDCVGVITYTESVLSLLRSLISNLHFTVLGGWAHRMDPPVVSGEETSCDLFWL